jgi:hypothetical protein
MYGSEGVVVVSSVTHQSKEPTLYCLNGECTGVGSTRRTYCSAANLSEAFSIIHQQGKSKIYFAIIDTANHLYNEEMANEVINTLCNNQPYENGDSITNSADSYGNQVMVATVSHQSGNEPYKIKSLGKVMSNICFSGIEIDCEQAISCDIAYGSFSAKMMPNFPYIVAQLKELQFTEDGIIEFCEELTEDLKIIN